LLLLEFTSAADADVGLRGIEYHYNLPVWARAMTDTVTCRHGVVTVGIISTNTIDLACTSIL